MIPHRRRYHHDLEDFQQLHLDTTLSHHRLPHRLFHPTSRITHIPQVHIPLQN
jgi:hypothetical protein